MSKRIWLIRIIIFAIVLPILLFAEFHFYGPPLSSDKTSLCVQKTIHVVVAKYQNGSTAWTNSTTSYVPVECHSTK